MATSHYELFQVTGIAEEPHGARVGLSTGCTAFLERDHPDYPWVAGRLYQGEHRRGPLGIWLDSQGKIIDVGGAFRGTVTGVQEPRPDLTEVKVWFEGMDGPMLLATEYEAFTDLYRQLVEAKERGQAVWYIMKGGYLLDVHALPVEKDALLCRLVERE